MFTSCNRIQWVGGVTCLQIVCRKTSVRVLVIWFYFSRMLGLICFYFFIFFEGSDRVFPSQSFLERLPDTLFLRAPVLLTWFHGWHQYRSVHRKNQHTLQISAASACILAHAHIHTQTAPHISHPVRTTTAAPLTRLLRPDGAKRLLVTQTGCLSPTMEQIQRPLVVVSGKHPPSSCLHPAEQTSPPQTNWVYSCLPVAVS